MKKFFVAAIAALTIAGFAAPQSASAGSVSYSTGLGPAALDWTMGSTTDTTQHISLPYFDPALFGGALPSSMTISFTGYMAPSPSSPVQIVNWSNASSSNASINGHWTFTVSNPALVPNFTFDQNINVSGISVASAPIPGYIQQPGASPSYTVIATGTSFFPMSGSQTYSPVPFIGTGNFTLDVTNTASIGFAGLNTSAAYVQWSMLAGGTITVTYEVPTPTPLALLGLGLAVIALVSRRSFGRNAA